MVSIAAVIRCRAGHEDTMARVLLDVARYVRDAEPDTRAFFISRDAGPSGLGLGRAVCSDLIHQGQPDRGEKEQTQ